MDKEYKNTKARKETTLNYFPAETFGGSGGEKRFLPTKSRERRVSVFFALPLPLLSSRGKSLGFLFTSTVVGRRVLCAFIRMAGIVRGSACIGKYSFFQDSWVAVRGGEEVDTIVRSDGALLQPILFTVMPILYWLPHAVLQLHDFPVVQAFPSSVFFYP